MVSALPENKTDVNREGMLSMRTVQSIVMIGCLLLPASFSFAAEKAFTLPEAYQSALRTNEVVGIAREGVTQADAVVDQARSYLFPRLTAKSSYTRYNEVLPPSGGFVFQPLDEFLAGMVLTQSIYTGGRTFAAYRTTQTLREVSFRQLTSAQQDIILSVSQAYYGVLKAGKLVGLSRASLARMVRHRKVAEREAATRRTKANISALLRANTLVSQAGIILTRSQDGLRIARQRLSILTGLPENVDLSEPAAVQEPAQSFADLKSLAYESREDLSSSRLNEKVAAENITIVKGAHYPQAYAEGALQYKSSDPETLTDGTIYYGGVRLTIPIFEGGLMRAEVAAARSQQRQAELATALLRKNVETEVFEAYVNLQTITSVLNTAKQQYSDAKENFDAVESLFGQGLASSLALIDAQQALFLAEREYSVALYDREVAVLQLQRSVGLLGKELLANST